MDLKLEHNQAALVLTIDEEGDFSVDVGSPDDIGAPAEICKAIAMKILRDETFQGELLNSVWQ